MLELTTEFIEGLMKFVTPREAKTEMQQFMELQRKRTEVIKDLREVDGIQCFNNTLVIKYVSSKLLSEGCLFRYAEKIISLQNMGKPEHNILTLFIAKERER